MSSASSSELRSLRNKNKVIIHKLNQVDRARVDRLRRAAKVGEVIFTKQGIFESTVCSACNYHHKLTSILNTTTPCPATEYGRKYYSDHVTERNSMESFPLNKLLNMKRTSPPVTGEPVVKKALPILRDQKPAGLVRPKTAGIQGQRARTMKPATSSDQFSLSRSKTPSAYGGCSSITNTATTSSSSMGVESIESSTDDDFLKEMVFPQFSFSDWSNLDKTEAEIEEMKRRLYREMFLQEEEALRIRLTKDRERYQQRIK